LLLLTERQLEIALKSLPIYEYCTDLSTKENQAAQFSEDDAAPRQSACACCGWGS
jgi:hypothetical protein